jgi:diguanylate cyclase (GGDEF)-like protein
MSIKLAVIGANQANVEEIKKIVIATVGGGAEIQTATILDYQNISEADLYICLINRRQEIENFFGASKVVALELVPPTEYFLEISRIPAGNSVVIFNNSSSGTKVLLKHLRRYNLMHLQYEMVSYDEMSEDEIRAKIALAKYITGGIAYLGPGNTLYAKYGESIRKDAVIVVSPARLATAESLSHLSNVYSSMYHQRMTEELRRLASTDYLTGIPNRRVFDETLRKEWLRARREKYSLSVAILDIDCFKNYNDQYGHIAGDNCLVMIAKMVKMTLKRPADFCARYGGEEFVVVLPDTDDAGSKQIIETIRTNIALLKIKHECSSIAPYVTISGGLVTTEPAMRTMKLSEFLRCADKALYEAKHQGRDQVVAVVG